MRYQEGKRRKTHARRRPQGQGCPDRTSQKAWKRPAKTRQTVRPSNRLPAFSPPTAARAGPERGPGRPSSLGAVPLGNLGNHWENLMFRSLCGVTHQRAAAWRGTDEGSCCMPPQHENQ